MSTSLYASAALIVLMALTASSASSQRAQPDRETLTKCGEIAHRISCHAISGACREGESDKIFEARYNLNSMIEHLCTSGPRDFDKYWWVDVQGTYRPYYLDKEGNQVKFPPAAR